MSLELFQTDPIVLFFFLAFVCNNEEDELSAEDRRRRDRRTPRIAIRRYPQSSFVYLFRSGSDQALLNCCGVDHKTFRVLLDLFEPKFHQYMLDEDTGHIRMVLRTQSGLPKGRKRNIDAIGVLGLVLFWF